MAKFCAECGGPLGPADKFCAECGKQVIHTCPTCGQNWDGVKQEVTAASSSKSDPKPVTAPPTKPTTPVVPPPPAKPAAKSSQLTTARIQPVYGSQYNAASDCANCGAKGNKKSCSNCGAGE